MRHILPADRYVNCSTSFFPPSLSLPYLSSTTFFQTLEIWQVRLGSTRILRFMAILGIFVANWLRALWTKNPKFFSSQMSPKQALRASYAVSSKGSFLRSKYGKREADYSSPISFEGRNSWNYTAIPPYTFMAVCLIKHGATVGLRFTENKSCWTRLTTFYGLDGLGIESQRQRDCLYLSRQTIGPTQHSIQ